MNNIRELKDEVSSLNFESDELDKYLKKYKSLEKKINNFENNYNTLENNYLSIKENNNEVNKKNKSNSQNTYNIEKILKYTNNLITKLNNINLDNINIDELKELVNSYEEFKKEETIYNEYINKLKITLQKVN